MGVDDSPVVVCVAVAAIFPPRREELTEWHGRPFPARESAVAHLALPLAFERLCGAAIGPGGFPELLPLGVSNRDPIGGSCLGLSRDDGHYLVSF